LTKKATSLPKRNEIPEQFKWKLEDIYESNEAWEKDFAKAKLLASNLKDFKDKIGESSDSLLKCLEAQAEVSRLFEKVYVYAQMRTVRMDIIRAWRTERILCL